MPVEAKVKRAADAWGDNGGEEDEERLYRTVEAAAVVVRHHHARRSGYCNNGFEPEEGLLLHGPELHSILFLFTETCDVSDALTSENCTYGEGPVSSFPEKVNPPPLARRMGLTATVQSEPWEPKLFFSMQAAPTSRALRYTRRRS